MTRFRFVLFALIVALLIETSDLVADRCVYPFGTTFSECQLGAAELLQAGRALCNARYPYNFIARFFCIWRQINLYHSLLDQCKTPLCPPGTSCIAGTGFCCASGWNVCAGKCFSPCEDCVMGEIVPKEFPCQTCTVSTNGSFALEQLCIGGQVCCNDVCVSTSTDTKNCGACGNDCTSIANFPKTVCLYGRCVCPPGGCGPLCDLCGSNQICKNDVCVCATNTCGSACVKCAANERCLGDACVVICSPDQTWCQSTVGGEWAGDGRCCVVDSTHKCIVGSDGFAMCCKVTATGAIVTCSRNDPRPE